MLKWSLKSINLTKKSKKQRDEGLHLLLHLNHLIPALKVLTNIIEESIKRIDTKDIDPPHQVRVTIAVGAEMKNKVKRN